MRDIELTIEDEDRDLQLDLRVTYDLDSDGSIVSVSVDRLWAIEVAFYVTDASGIVSGGKIYLARPLERSRDGCLVTICDQYRSQIVAAIERHEKEEIAERQDREAKSIDDEVDRVRRS